MMVRLAGARFESWAAIRYRMLRETEVFIEEGLAHPERQMLIPAIPVGRGRFPPGFAQLFWSQVLETS